MSHRTRLRAALLGGGLGFLVMTIWDIAYGDRAPALILSALAALCLLALAVIG